MNDVPLALGQMLDAAAEPSRHRRSGLTGSGKVQKFRQKAWAVERYGFSGPA